MRKILFKAKRLDNCEWVEGYYYFGDFGVHMQHVEKKHYIITECGVYCVIDPETLCQYTGLVDKNGQKIWENDICIIEVLEEIQQYREIGSVEECKEAVKKQKAKKPITYSGTNRADCPICGATVRGIAKPFGDFCSKCGQRLIF